MPNFRGTREHVPPWEGLKVLSGIIMSCVINDLAYIDTCVCIAQNKENSNALDFVTRRLMDNVKTL